MATAISGISTKETLSWHQCPEAVRNYLANVTYDPSDYTTSQIANYAPAVAIASNTKPIGKTVDGTTFYNEVPNKQTPFSTANAAGTLTPLDTLRWINCPHVTNVRDLGGWSCDGGTVKYGLLFRGGEPTAQDKDVLVDECGVRFEMNLRGRVETQRETTVFGEGVGYTIYDNYAWYSIADTALWKQMLRTVFDCAVCSIPIYFHCAAGLDRTGTFACILEALLGVSQSDCDKDYELSCFSTGTDTDAHARRRNESEWQGLIAQINAQTGSTFRDKVVNFVLSLGISVNDINRFRSVMIDGTPEVLVSTDYTVTNTLTNVSNNNSAQSVEKYQPYITTLTPNAGYLINSVIVTMGGTDITNQVFNGTIAPMRYTVSNNLTNCVTDNYVDTVIEGATYTATLTPNAGYIINLVTITMGGIDVSNYYSDGTISIPSVTGNIVITATAQQSARENLLTMNDGNINQRIKTDGTLSPSNGDFVTDYFAFNYNTATGLRIVKGVTNVGNLGTTGAYGNCRLTAYDANKTLLGNWYIGRGVNNTIIKFTVDGDDLVKSNMTTDVGSSAAGPGVSDWSTVKYIRLGLALNNAASAIGSVDDVLNSGMKIYAE